MKNLNFIFLQVRLDLNKSHWKFLKKDLTGLQKSTTIFFFRSNYFYSRHQNTPQGKLKNGEDRFKTIVQQFTLICSNKCLFLASLFKDTCIAIIPHFSFSRFIFYFFVKHLHFYPIFLITMVVLIDIVEAVEAPNGNFRESICSEDDLRSRIFEHLM